jgi:hypothetical protein
MLIAIPMVTLIMFSMGTMAAAEHPHPSCETRFKVLMELEGMRESQEIYLQIYIYMFCLYFVFVCVSGCSCNDFFLIIIIVVCSKI